MKILILIQCTNLGGMEQAALEFAKELQRLGHGPEFLSLTPVGDLGPVLESAGIPVSGIEYRGAFGWKSFFPLKKKLKGVEADALIMFGHNLMGMLALGGFCADRRILTLHFHHQGVMPPLLWKILYAVASRKFRKMVFPSEFIRDEAFSLSPWIRKQSHILRNPVASHPIVSPEEKQSARSTIGVAEDGPIVGNAGWLIPRKRWDVFLRVAERVLESRPDARFLIAGDGPERSSLESLAIELGISNRVHSIGWKKDLDVFFKSLDVLLFNSDWDAMGRTPLEAMTYGVPVVASVTHGGLGEVMDSEQHGFFLGEHDIERLAGYVLRLLDDPVLAASTGEAGRIKMKEDGDSRKYADSLIQLLNEPRK
jgi:glycosyltransferase involved in cell wall biosynthesis